VYLFRASELYCDHVSQSNVYIFFAVWLITLRYICLLTSLVLDENHEFTEFADNVNFGVCRDFSHLLHFLCRKTV